MCLWHRTWNDVAKHPPQHNHTKKQLPLPSWHRRMADERVRACVRAHAVYELLTRTAGTEERIDTLPHIVNITHDDDDDEDGSSHRPDQSAAAALVEC